MKAYIARGVAKPSVFPRRANAPAKLRGCWTEVRQIFNRHRRVIGSVNAHIRIAILPSAMECQRTEWIKVVYANLFRCIRCHGNDHWAIAIGCFDYEAHWSLYKLICCKFGEDRFSNPRVTPLETTEACVFCLSDSTLCHALRISLERSMLTTFYKPNVGHTERKFSICSGNRRRIKGDSVRTGVFRLFGEECSDSSAERSCIWRAIFLFLSNSGKWKTNNIMESDRTPHLYGPVEYGSNWRDRRMSDIPPGHFPSRTFPLTQTINLTLTLTMILTLPTLTLLTLPKP